MPDVIHAAPATEAGQKARDAVIAMLAPKGGAGWAVVNTANAVGALVASAYTLVVLAFSAIFGAAATLAVLFLEGIEQVKQSNQDKLNEVSAAALSDILGIEISAGDIPKQGSGGGSTALFVALGGKVLRGITSALGGGQDTQAGPGEKGAEAFMGLGLNFAVMSAIIGLTGELASLGFIEGFEDLGQDVMRSLGMGRLMRQALHPLINSTITLPYTYETNAKYKPHVLSVGEYITMLQAGRISPDAFNEAIARHGFPDNLRDELLIQHRHKLSAQQVDTLVRWGRITRDAGVAMLVAHGMDSDTANYELDLLDLARGDAQENAYAAELLKLTQERFIDPTTFSTLLQRLHFSPSQLQGWLNRVGVYLDTQSKRLTLGELLYLAEHHLVTLDQIDAWAKAEGYNEEGAAMLDLWITQKELDWDAIQAAKAARKKKPPPPPAPTQ